MPCFIKHLPQFLQLSSKNRESLPYLLVTVITCLSDVTVTASPSSLPSRGMEGLGDEVTSTVLTPQQLLSYRFTRFCLAPTSLTRSELLLHHG